MRSASKSLASRGDKEHNHKVDKDASKENTDVNNCSSSSSSKHVESSEPAANSLSSSGTHALSRSGSQPLAPETGRGLFATPVAGGRQDSADYGGGGRVGGPATCARDSVSTPQGGGHKVEGEGDGGSSEECAAGEGAKSETVQHLEKRLALARQQITPLKEANDGKASLLGDTDAKDAGECEQQDGHAGDPLTGEALTCGQDNKMTEEQQESTSDPAKEQDAGDLVPTAMKEAVPFAKWLASGCPIGSKSRVSGAI